MIQNVFGFDDIAVGTICTHRREYGISVHGGG